MSTTKRESIIKDDGQIVRRTITEEVLLVADDVVDSLSSEICRRATCLVVTTLGPANLVIDYTDYCWWSITLPLLPLKTAYAMNNGALVPVWRTDGDDPVIAMEWKPPPGMSLHLLFKIVKNGNYYMNMGWLFARDTAGGSHWRLPVGNVYEDCHICMGYEIGGDRPFNGISPTSVACLEKCAVQFKQATWNADLTDRHQATQSNALFRFSPKDEGFTQLEPSAEWTTCCQKVVLDSITKHICL